MAVVYNTASICDWAATVVNIPITRTIITYIIVAFTTDIDIQPIVPCIVNIHKHISRCFHGDRNNGSPSKSPNRYPPSPSPYTAIMMKALKMNMSRTMKRILNIFLFFYIFLFYLCIHPKMGRWVHHLTIALFSFFLFWHIIYTYFNKISSKNNQKKNSIDSSPYLKFYIFKYPSSWYSLHEWEWNAFY